MGFLYISVNERGELRRITSASTPEDLARKAFEEDEEGAIHDQGRVAHVLQQLREYFEGARREFQLGIDWTGLTPFQQRVLQVTRHIPFGHTLTYKEVALQAGSPRAARAAGQALARNPVAIVVPCHRVVAHDGSLCGFSAEGGIATKRWLLTHESNRAP